MRKALPAIIGASNGLAICLTWQLNAQVGVTVLAVSALLEQQANECAANCNPQNPEVAKAVLTQWLDRAKLAIKEPTAK